jgi:hypothetical protein
MPSGYSSRMAHLVISGDQVSMQLSLLESLGAFAKSPSVPLADVESVEIVENPWTSAILKGVRAPGTGVPFVVLLGTMRYRGGKDLCAIYKRRPNAVVTLKSGPFKRWIFEIKDMQEIDALKQALS